MRKEIRNILMKNMGARLGDILSNKLREEHREKILDNNHIKVTVESKGEEIISFQYSIEDEGG